MQILQGCLDFQVVFVVQNSTNKKKVTKRKLGNKTKLQPKQLKVYQKLWKALPQLVY